MTDFVFCFLIITYLTEKDNGEKLIAKAEIVKVRGNKYFVWVKTHNDTQEVFRAKFIMVSWGEE